MASPSRFTSLGHVVLILGVPSSDATVADIASDVATFGSDDVVETTLARLGVAVNVFTRGFWYAKGA